MRLTVLVILLVACGEPPKPKQPASPAPVTPAAPANPLAAKLPVWSDVAGPDGPVAFKRDFKKPGSWSYGYTHDLTLTGGVHGRSDVTPMKSKGSLAVESQGDGTAVIRLTTNTTVQGDSGPIEMEPQVIELPLGETGLAQAKDNNAALLALLFPIPSKPMMVGETESVQFSLPVTGIPGMTSAGAPLDFKLVGFSKLGGRTCARFDTSLVIDVKQAAAHVTLQLAGRTCLDPTDGALVASFLAMDMRITNTGDQPIDMSIAGTMALDRAP